MAVNHLSGKRVNRDLRITSGLPVIPPRYGWSGSECNRLIALVRNPYSTEALEVVSLQQLGVLPLRLLQTGNFRIRFFPDT